MILSILNGFYKPLKLSGFREMAIVINMQDRHEGILFVKDHNLIIGIDLVIAVGYCSAKDQN